MRQGDYFQNFLFLFYFIFFSSYNSKKELAQDHVGLIIKSLVSLSKTVSSFFSRKFLLKSKGFCIHNKNIRRRSLAAVT